MHASEPRWLAPTSLDEALALRDELRDEATVVAGGTFLGILLNQRLLEPAVLLVLRGVGGLDTIAANGELELGAMVTHRAVERSAAVREGWPALAHAFSVVGNRRVRAQATVGGVLADADYASDPPAMLSALGARVVLRSGRGERELAVEDFVLGHYETALAPDELVVAVRVPRPDAAVYRKFRSRSHEDRPCVAVAAARTGGELRVVVGAVAGRPQLFPELCASGDADRIARGYADAIDPISDVRGSADYRRRVIEVEVRRAVDELG